MTPEQLAQLYDKKDAANAEKGVKGEKASAVREQIRKLVAAMKKNGQVRLSATTIKGVVCEALATKAEDGTVVPFKIDASQFNSIVANMYETEKDATTGVVTVLTDSEKAPKVRQPRGKKTEAAPQ